MEVNINGTTDPAQTAPQTAPQAVPESNTDLSAAVAALTAALKQPAPTTEPKQEPVVEPAPQGGLNDLDLDSLEPASKSMAVAFKALAGNIDLERVFAKAIDEGDVSRLDLAYLREKAPQHYNDLAELAKSLVQSSIDYTSKLVQDVHSLAGGPDNWNASVAAFNEKAPEAVREVVKTMLNSGKGEQVKAAAQLVAEFAKDNGFIQTGKLLNSPSATVNASQALNAAEFKEAVRALDGSSRTHDAEYAALVARRRLGMQLGK